jgi:tetratricopeptide (TPR) repeat protein
VTYWRDDIPLWEHTLKVTRNNSTANLNYGYLLGQQGRLDEAITHLEAALAADPKDQDALTNLGIAHASKGDYPQAEECFQRALKIRPDHYLVHFNLGLLARLKNDTTRAITEFQAAARIGSDNPNPMLRLATIWMEQGAVTSATECLKDARRRAEASGDIEMVKQIEKKLRSMASQP